MRGLRSVSQCVLLLALLGASCTIDPSALDVADTFFQGPNERVDLVFVVDDSNSMEAIQTALATEAPAFLTALEATGADYRAGVVTTDMNDPSRRGRLVAPWISPADPQRGANLVAALQVGGEGSQLERGLHAAWAAITPPLATHDNEGLVREDSRLAVVIVSDEDDCSDEGALPSGEPSACAQFPGSLVSVAEYAARLRSMVDDPADVAVHAIVETGVTAEQEGCGGLNVGSRYIELAQLLGGMVAPHCADASSLMEELALQVAGRRSSFPLSRVPDPLTISVILAQDVEPLGDDDDSAASPAGTEVDPNEALVGASVPEDPTRTNGWTWDEASNTLQLWGQALPGLGDAVQIRYQVVNDGG